MKKTLCSILLILCSLTVLLPVASCKEEKTTQKFEDVIVFGENYVLEGTEPLFHAGDENYRFVLVFYQDGTGTYDIRYSGRAEENLSGTIQFVWKTASDGAVYLFEKERSYNDGHQDLDNIPGGSHFYLIDSPLYFGKDFVTYTIDGGTRSRHPKFIRENSELAS